MRKTFGLVLVKNSTLAPGVQNSPNQMLTFCNSVTERFLYKIRKIILGSENSSDTRGKYYEIPF